MVCLQLKNFYGPLLATITASRSAFRAMVRQHSPDGTKVRRRRAREGRPGGLFVLVTTVPCWMGTREKGHRSHVSVMFSSYRIHHGPASRPDQGVIGPQGAGEAQPLTSPPPNPVPCAHLWHTHPTLLPPQPLLPGVLPQPSSPQPPSPPPSPPLPSPPPSPPPSLQEAFQAAVFAAPDGPEARAYRVWMAEVLQPLNERAAKVS